MFQRDLRESVWDRIQTFIVAALNDLLRWLPDVGLSPKVLLLIAAALVLVLAMRLVSARRARADWTLPDPARPSAHTDAWREAQRLAAAGDHTAAAHALCAALLLRCASRGELRLHPSKTTGDYARELRRKPAPSAGAFQRFRLRYDRVIYDLQRCSPEEYAALLADAQPLLAEGRAA